MDTPNLSFEAIELTKKYQKAPPKNDRAPKLLWSFRLIPSLDLHSQAASKKKFES